MVLINSENGLHGNLKGDYVIKGGLYARVKSIMDLEHVGMYYEDRFPILKIKQAERIFDENGIDQNGFNENGHYVRSKSSLTLDEDGYNALGYNIDGYDRNGYDVYGLDKHGFDEYGYRVRGTDKEGYDREGYDREGYDREGYNRAGEKRPKIESEEKSSEIESNNKSRNCYLGLIRKAQELAEGKLTLEDYIKKSKTSIEELIAFAKKQHMSADIIRKLYSYKNPYKLYKKPFNKTEYLKTTILTINGEEVRPTEEDVDRCIKYLKTIGSLICNKTVCDTVRKFKNGEIDITIESEELQDTIEKNNEGSKEKLIKEIIGQQETIKLQEEKMSELRKQRRI